MTFMGLWAERAAADPSGRNDLITMLAHGEDTRDMVTRPLEFLGNIMLLIVGGNDTTRNSISGGVLALNEFPDQFEKLTSPWKRPASRESAHSQHGLGNHPLADARPAHAAYAQADYAYAGKQHEGRRKSGDVVHLRQP